MELMLQECGGCGTTYLTSYESGNHVCPECGYTDELVNFIDLLPVKIASLEEVTCGSDAQEKFHGWLQAYAESQGGGNYVVRQVDIRKSLDGWYAILPAPPQFIETDTVGQR